MTERLCTVFYPTARALALLIAMTTGMLISSEPPQSPLPETITVALFDQRGSLTDVDERQVVVALERHPKEAVSNLDRTCLLDKQVAEEIRSQYPVMADNDEENKFLVSSVLLGEQIQSGGDTWIVIGEEPTYLGERYTFGLCRLGSLRTDNCVKVSLREEKIGMHEVRVVDNQGNSIPNVSADILVGIRVSERPGRIWFKHRSEIRDGLMDVPIVGDDGAAVIWRIDDAQQGSVVHLPSTMINKKTLKEGKVILAALAPNLAISLKTKDNKPYYSRTDPITLAIYQGESCAGRLPAHEAVSYFYGIKTGEATVRLEDMTSSVDIGSITILDGSKCHAVDLVVPGEITKALSGRLVNQDQQPISGGAISFIFENCTRKVQSNAEGIFSLRYSDDDGKLSRVVSLHKEYQPFVCDGAKMLAVLSKEGASVVMTRYWRTRFINCDINPCKILCYHNDAAKTLEWRHKVDKKEYDCHMKPGRYHMQILIKQFTENGRDAGWIAAGTRDVDVKDDAETIVDLGELKAVTQRVSIKLRNDAAVQPRVMLIQSSDGTTQAGLVKVVKDDTGVQATLRVLPGTYDLALVDDGTLGYLIKSIKIAGNKTDPITFKVDLPQILNIDATAGRFFEK